MTDLAICRSQPSPQDPRSSQSYRRGSSRIPSQAEEGERLSTPATVLVQAAIEAWEKKDASALASYLSDDLICRHVLPQSVGKAQLIAFMEAIATAFPDWSFNGRVLHEESLADQCWNVLYVTTITGTNKGDLSLPTLPIIPATGRSVIMGPRHLKFLVAGAASRQSTPTTRPAGWRKFSLSWGWNSRSSTSLRGRVLFPEDLPASFLWFHRRFLSRPLSIIQTKHRKASLKMGPSHRRTKKRREAGAPLR